MFEELFAQPWTIRSYRAAPLVEERVRYLRHLAESGARPKTLERMAATQVVLVYLLDLKQGDNVTACQVEAVAKERPHPRPHQYLSNRPTPPPPEETALFIGRAVRWLRFLGWLEEPLAERHPHTAEVAAYEAWMRRERGFSEATIHGYCVAANDLFDWLATFDIPLASVKTTDIDGAITAKRAMGTWSRTTIRIYTTRLRAFFRFAEDRGWCVPGIAAGIAPVHRYPTENVPVGLTREDVLRLLATTEGERPVDKRDRAILMLFTAYGLRAGEVAGLQLDDLDWEQETLRVRRPKPGRTHLYPLSQGVGQAILRYILEVRPSCSERTLFLTLAAPIRPLQCSSLSTVVGKRLNRLGITAKRRGAHALRHSAAQHLLDQGMSMKVIGDFLGHRDPESTAVYAKIELNALREVANFDLEGLA